MKAKIKESYVPTFSNRNMQNREYTIDSRCSIFSIGLISVRFGTRIIDFKLDNVEILNEGMQVEVHRNQAVRDGVWLGYCELNKGYILEYSMPNGRKFKNLVKNPFITNKYTTKIKTS